MHITLLNDIHFVCASIIKMNYNRFNPLKSSGYSMSNLLYQSRIPHFAPFKLDSPTQWPKWLRAQNILCYFSQEFALVRDLVRKKQHLGFHSRIRYSSYNSNRIVLCLFIISRNSSNFCTSYKLAEAGALFLLKFFKWMIRHLNCFTVLCNNVSH